MVGPEAISVRSHWDVNGRSHMEPKGPSEIGGAVATRYIGACTWGKEAEKGSEANAPFTQSTILPNSSLNALLRSAYEMGQRATSSVCLEKTSEVDGEQHSETKTSKTTQSKRKRDAEDDAT